MRYWKGGAIQRERPYETGESISIGLPGRPVQKHNNQRARGRGWASINGRRRGGHEINGSILRYWRGGAIQRERPCETGESISIGLPGCPAQKHNNQRARGRGWACIDSRRRRGGHEINGSILSNKWIGSEGLLWPEKRLPRFIFNLNIKNGHYKGRLASCQILNPVASCARYLLWVSVAHLPDGSHHRLPVHSFRP